MTVMRRKSGYTKRRADLDNRPTREAPIQGGGGLCACGTILSIYNQNGSCHPCIDAAQRNVIRFGR